MMVPSNKSRFEALIAEPNAGGDPAALLKDQRLEVVSVRAIGGHSGAKVNPLFFNSVRESYCRRFPQAVPRNYFFEVRLNI